MESRKTNDGEDNFGGPRWYVYLVHIDAAFSTRIDGGVEGRGA